MKEITKVNYNRIKCSNEHKAICPYCEYENKVDAEDYGDQDENQLDYCCNCEKQFIRQINYTVTFSTEPVENYYIREKERLQNRIECLKSEFAKDDAEKQYIDFYLESCEYDLEQLKNKYGGACILNSDII